MIVTTLLISLIILAKSKAEHGLINEHLSEFERSGTEQIFPKISELPNVSKITKSEVNRNSSTIRYMLDLYNFHISRENGDVYNTRNKRSITLSRKTRTALTASHKVVAIPVTFKSLNKGKELSFVAWELSSNEKDYSELRIFQNGTISKKNDELFVIKVYQILDTENQKLQYVSSVNTTGKYIGWLSINMKLNFDERKTEGRLYVSVYSLQNQEELPTEDIGLIFENDGNDTTPFIVGFFSSSNYIKKPLSKSPSAEGCKLQKLILRMENVLEEIGTTSVNDVIAPESYDAGLCLGECQNCSLILENNNYFKVLKRLNLNRGLGYSDSACCGPTEYRSISVLYLHDEENSNVTNVVLKNIKNISVKSCGCS